MFESITVTGRELIIFIGILFGVQGLLCLVYHWWSLNKILKDPFGDRELPPSQPNCRSILMETYQDPKTKSLTDKEEDRMRHPLEGIPCSEEDRKLLVDWLVSSLRGVDVPVIFFPVGSEANGKASAGRLLMAILPDVRMVNRVVAAGYEGSYVIPKHVPPGHVSGMKKITIELHKKYHLTAEEYEPLRIASGSHENMKKHLMLYATGCTNVL